MLGSTYGTLTNDPRDRAAQAGRERPGDADVDVGGRPLAVAVPDLDRLFRPTAVAVLGASDIEGRPATTVTRWVMCWAERVGARVHPVRSGRGTVFGTACAASVAELPGDVEVAVLAAGDPLRALGELAGTGVRFAVAADPAGQGVADPERWAAAAARAGIRLLGPGAGVFGPSDATPSDTETDATGTSGTETDGTAPSTTGPSGTETHGTGADTGPRQGADGPAVALVTRTRHQGRPLAALAELGVRISHWAATGDGADLGAADLLAYLAGRPEVGAVACQLGEVTDGRALLLAADHAARRGVPIVAVRTTRAPGATHAGGGTGLPDDDGPATASARPVPTTSTVPATAAAPATAPATPATGPDRVRDAALRQFGVVPVDTPDQLRDTATLLARARPPRADGVAVYALSGAETAHFAGLLSAAGLPLAALGEGTREALRAALPGHPDAPEPVGGEGHPAGDRRGRRALDALLADPAVGLLVCPVAAPVPPLTDRLARDLVEAAEASGTPVCVVWGSAAGTEAAYRRTLLGSSRVTTFRTAGGCVAAVAAYFAHHRFAAAYRSPFDEAPRTPSPALRKARAQLRPGRRLSEHGAKQLLRAYGIRVPREQLVTSAAAAVRAAGQVGYPVALKASAPHLAHRTGLGLVRLGLTSASQVRDTYRELADIARYEHVDLDGVLVCQLVEGGVEMRVGLAHDPAFGPVVTVGLGGVLGEVLTDTAVRVAPFGAAEARGMLDELPGRALLDGVRGGPPLDVDALVEVVLRVQRMGLELGGEVAELVVDPLVVLERGQGAVALGAHARCRPGG
ncbi:MULTISPECIES: acetate--CoA ligase family protein [Streptomyces]|uniref:Pimeloyl-CoA synthetase n=2 Tax=Streptomyces TaxID=1883 RepID=A0A100Y3K0_9ACTN|nr:MULTISPECIES: acetate--CoA ligase family protein [Streptomyces]KUH37022.1 pimeloyl-CoA synthetase [Streptomyces kanasensis]UUS31650.1 acetate--CoA ligase family protein [Streptomyces changanensis]